MEHNCVLYQASFIRAILQWGGGLGGWVFSWVGGSEALDPAPPYNSEGLLGRGPATPSFFAHRCLVWRFAGAPVAAAVTALRLYINVIRISMILRCTLVQ